jgi:hypothetical protein
MQQYSTISKAGLIILLGLLAGCNSVSKQTITPSFTVPSNTITSTSTRTLKPTGTKIPTLTPRPTDTPTRTLAPTQTLAPALTTQFLSLDLPHKGPLLAYMQGSTLMLVDVESHQRTAFTFEDDASFAPSPLDGLSPHASYFAYFRGGTVDPESNYLSAVDKDFSLVILDLNNRQSIHSENLINKDYPANLEPMASKISENSMVPKEEASWGIQDALIYGIQTLAWTSNSGLLAFASQSRSPSSDLFFYSPILNDSWQVSSEPWNVLSATWAPNSNQIAVSTMEYSRHGAPTITYVFSRDGKLILTNRLGWFAGWANSQQILKTQGTDYGDGSYDLEAINVSNGSSVMLWPYSYADLAMSPDLKDMVITSNEDVLGQENALEGLIGEIPRSSDPRLLSGAENWITEYWGSDQFEFAASAPKEGTMGIKHDGSLVQIDSLPWEMASAPDSTLLALYGAGYISFAEAPNSKGLRVVDYAGNLIQILSHSPVHCVEWRPDSSGLAFGTKDGFYYWDSISKSVLLIDNSQSCGKWVNN